MKTETNTKSLAIVNKEISKELADPAIVRGLLATTFKGLQEPIMRQAIFEGIVRGFKFKDFLEGNVFAIPFGSGYSLVTSIKYANKIAQKNGVWVSGPKFEMEEKKIVSCSITAYKRIGQDIGEWTATVFFDEYTTGKNLWNSKPRTMLAKVCLSHVYRMACPEEMSQVYTAEEFDKEADKEGDFDRSPVEDDVVIISTGDDMTGIQGASEVVIPTSATERKVMILKELKRIDPSFDMEDEKAAKLMVADLTELEYTVKNYGNIIHMLMRK